MSYGPKRHVKRRASKALNLIARAALAGMKTEKHTTVSRRWAGPGHAVYSATIDGVVVYRASRAALARIYLDLLP